MEKGIRLREKSVVLFNEGWGSGRTSSSVFGEGEGVVYWYGVVFALVVMNGWSTHLFERV